MVIIRYCIKFINYKFNLIFYCAYFLTKYSDTSFNVNFAVSICPEASSSDVK